MWSLGLLSLLSTLLVSKPIPLFLGLFASTICADCWLISKDRNAKSNVFTHTLAKINGTTNYLRIVVSNETYGYLCRMKWLADQRIGQKIEDINKPK